MSIPAAQWNAFLHAGRMLRPLVSPSLIFSYPWVSAAPAIKLDRIASSFKLFYYTMIQLQSS